MAEIGSYCKAYPVSMFRKYEQWSETPENVRKEQKMVDGRIEEIERTLGDDDILYLQENFVVTDGIFLNENIIFDRADVAWKEYCKSVLNFEVPLRAEAQPVG
jgi:DMSO/TMAO reductase YedYZ molybdopterin-dependent catalytic subunit